MNIITVHNYYQQRGGEDRVFSSESRLLERRGHNVFRYTMHNDLIANMNGFKLAISTIWNQRAASSLKYLVEQHKPQVIHFHNTFPLISPGSYYVKNNTKPVIIQTIHNFRILCAGALFLQKGKVCERCMLKTVPWAGAVNACYRESFMYSAVTVVMMTIHQLLKTWQKKIDRFIALTEFAKEKFIQGGIHPSKIEVKPNFVYPDPGFNKEKDKYALFVGRLSNEKGIITLLNAWKNFRPILLKIAGSGPLEDKIKKIVIRDKLHNVEIIGQLNQSNCINLMKRARFLLFPSECYEVFGNIIVEAFACGLPVIASKLGSMAEIVENGVTGLHFEAGNPIDLAVKIKWLIDHPNECRQMGNNARKVFLDKYTAEKNYETLIDIYQKAIANYK